MTLANYLRLIDLAEQAAQAERREHEHREIEDLLDILAPYYRDAWTHDTDC